MHFYLLGHMCDDDVESSKRVIFLDALAYDQFNVVLITHSGAFLGRE